jgi:hypothetical protein
MAEGSPLSLYASQRARKAASSENSQLMKGAALKDKVNALFDL